MDSAVLMIDAVALVVVLTGAGYAVQLMRSTKGGTLSGSWKYIAEGWVVLAAGQVAFVFSSGQSDLAPIVGGLLSVVGGGMMALGFRKHLAALRPS